MEANFSYPAEYYDEDYTIGVPDRGDIAFYRKHAVQQGDSILELACGTGRVLIPIAQSGIDCYGLDAARPMLAICETKIQAMDLRNVHLMYASMDDFNYDKQFSMIYCAFRSFQHLLSVEQQIRCLELVRKHLRDDGVFIMDVFAPNIEKLANYLKKGEGWEKEFSRKNEQTESTITRYYQARVNLTEQIIDVVMKWEERNSEGILVAKKEGAFNLRYLFRFELEHLLSRCGFAPTFYGTFGEKPYDYTSGETIAVCKKA